MLDICDGFTGVKVGKIYYADLTCADFCPCLPSRYPEFSFRGPLHHGISEVPGVWVRDGGAFASKN